MVDDGSTYYKAMGYTGQTKKGGSKMVDQESREGILSVTKTLSHMGKEISSEETPERLRIRPFETNPASISVKAGVTINLGNYESGRVDVMLTMPCYVEELDDVYEATKNWVDSRVEHERKEIEKAIGK